MVKFIYYILICVITRCVKKRATLYLLFWTIFLVLTFLIYKMLAKHQTEKQDQTAPSGAVWSWSALID